MNLLRQKEEELFDFDDGGLYSEYLLNKGRELPDKWKPRTAKHEGEYVPFVYFTDEMSNLKDYCKAYAYQLHALASADPKTINAKISCIRNFIRALSAEAANVNACMKESFLEHIGNSQRKIKEHFFDGGKTNKVKSVRGSSLVLLDFILFLNQYSNDNEWAVEFDFSKELPEKLVRYFTKEELEAYRLQFNRQIEKSKTPALSWLATYEVVKFLENIEHPHYGKSAIIICLEAGLRISEVRTLRINCLKPIAEQEKIMIMRHFDRLKREAPLKLDYSDSRWLHYSVTKGKKGDIVTGTPVLVGRRVVDAIEDIIGLTKELRKEAESDMLFLNKVRNNKNPFAVRSYASFLNDLRELFEQGMPPLRFHKLRATFATILHRLNVPIGMIEKYMNHVSSQVTAGYIDAQRNESSDTMAWLLDNKVDDAQDNEQLRILQEELFSLVGTTEFFGLSHNSRISLFERLAKRFNIKIKMSDHGACVLPIDKVCPNGFEGVLPCHAADCKKFHPDQDAEDFFVALLENNKERIEEIRELVEKTSNIMVDIEMLKIADISYRNIIKKIKGTA